ncbi:unnamed protein product [Strongylus vulgaris]|uniref:EF-hand domain-containing protein n=1 Tax=Strongylus vulgaris TaxID=40348 RepID=A0A3P7LBP6_STRVU|nr:unnamed protein product [Strongylus vulgaris]
MSEVERLFNLCDSEGKGYLTEQDLQHICPQLDQKDIEFIFAQLDTDGSGRIDKEEFCNGFNKAVLEGESRGYGGMKRRASVIDYSGNSDEHKLMDISELPLIRAGEEVFDSDAETPFPRPSRLRTLDEEVYNSESDTNASIDFALPCHEEVVMLYQQLQSAGVPQLLRKYERIVGSFYKEIKDQKDENQRLQHVFETEKDMYNKRMEEVELEIDQQVMIAERKAREERLQKMENVLEKEGQKLTHQKELQERLKEVCSENTELRRGLAENHLELAMIKSELAHVRAEYEHKENELIRQKDEVSAVSQESENMQRQIQLLFEANKKLHDTNESLRDALDSRASVIKQFNLRTPSPNLVRTASEGVALFQREGQDSLRLPTPVTFSELATEDDVRNLKQMINVIFAELMLDSGLTASFDDGNCSSDSEKPKGDVEPVMVSVDFHVKTVCADGRNVALQLWDTAGQERFRSLCKSYFRRADGAILVYDVSSEHSFIKIRDWVDTIKVSSFFPQSL